MKHLAALSKADEQWRQTLARATVKSGRCWMNGSGPLSLQDLLLGIALGVGLWICSRITFS
jgi:hypothetical protein